MVVEYGSSRMSVGGSGWVLVWLDLLFRTCRFWLVMRVLAQGEIMGVLCQDVLRAVLETVGFEGMGTFRLDVRLLSAHRSRMYGFSIFCCIVSIVWSNP